MRTIKELLILLTKYYKGAPYTGICNTVNGMEDSGLISFQEFQELNTYLKANKPSSSLHAEFFDVSEKPFGYWWPIKSTLEQDVVKIRMNYLDYLINETH